MTSTRAERLVRLSVAAAFVGLATCSPKAQPGVTSLRVIPTFDAAWGIDQIEIAAPAHDTKVPDAPAPLTSGLSVVVAIGDGLAGAPMTLAVSGLHGGAKVAEASVTSTPVAGQNVDVPVALAATAVSPVCTSECLVSCTGACNGCACKGEDRGPMCVGTAILRTFGGSARCVAGVCTNFFTDAACPSPPENADAVCANGKCDFVCRDGFKKYGAGCFRPNSWTTIGMLPDWLCNAQGVGGVQAAAMERDGRLLAFTNGGVGGISESSLSEWTPTVHPSHFSSQYGFAVAMSRSGSGYVIGGAGGSVPITDAVYAYDPAAVSWKGAASMPTARSDLAVVTGQDGWIYALGGKARVVNDAGVTQSDSTVVEAYDPATDRWVSLAPMITRKSDFSAAVAEDGRIFTFAGKDVEVYSVSQNSWAPAASPPAVRWGGACATLGDGRILCIGGVRDGVDDTREVDSYDPSTNTWATVADIGFGRNSAAALTGPDGRVYLVGGGYFNGGDADACRREIEVYTP